MSVREQAIFIEATSIADALDAELEQAVREHTSGVYRVAFSVLRNHQDAEDVTQEAFLRFMRVRKRLDRVRDQRAWLARTVWRLAVSRQRRRPEISLDHAAETIRQMRASGEEADEIAAKREMIALLESLIESLPRGLRDALRLSTLEELSSHEIATMLGIPEGSVRTRLMRAREILRKKFEAVLEGNHGRKRS